MLRVHRFGDIKGVEHLGRRWVEVMDTVGAHDEHAVFGAHKKIAAGAPHKLLGKGLKRNAVHGLSELGISCCVFGSPQRTWQRINGLNRLIRRHIY